MKIFLSVILLFFIGCGSLSEQAVVNPDIFYKRDMVITVNGNFSDVGAIVVPKMDNYTIEVESAGRLDLFTLETCHREMSWEKGFGKDNKYLKTVYTPTKDMEVIEACPVILGGYELGKKRHSWGFIDFESDLMTLPAFIKCNGERKKYNGVSVCQSKFGLIQEIVFDTPTFVATSQKNADKGCYIEQAKDGKNYRYKMSKGQCTFTFGEQIKDGKFHRFTTLGYEEILIRGK